VRRLFLRLGFALLMLGGLPAVCAPQADSSPKEGNALVFIVNGITWQELRSPELPHISRFLQNSAAGLMNTRGADDRDADSVWVTLGAGRGAAAGVKKAEIAFGGDGPADIVNFAEITSANRRAHSQASPGLLGQLLSHGGIHRAFIGLDYSSSLSPMLAADTAGKIPFFASLSSEETGALRRPLSPLLSQGRAFIVISLTIPEEIIPGSYPKIDQPSERRDALRRADALFGEMVDASSSGDLLILLSPSCPRFSNPYSRAFASIALSGPGFREGLLFSQSTHREGLAVNVDFAPAILRFFGLPAPIQMTGRPLESRASPAPLKMLDDLDRRTAIAYRLREEFTRLFVPIVGGLFTLVLSILVFTPKIAARGSKFAAAALLLMAASLLAIFLLSASPIDQPITYLAAAFVLAAIIAAAASRMSRFPAAFGLICLATAAAFWTDLLAGSPLMHRSLLGFDPITCGRFYGLGNAEAGFLISSVILGAGVLLDFNPGPAARRLIAVFTAVVILSIGLPIAGANWGQGLSGVLTALALWLLLAPAGARWKRLPAAVLLFLGAAAFIIALEFLLPPAHQSHLGYSLRLGISEGLGAFPAIIARKLIMAGRLSTFSPFFVLAFPVLAALIILPLRPPYRLREVIGDNRGFAAALAACGIGGIAASLLNDSGIVAGISIICLPLVGLAYLSLEARRESLGY
jgi:hypothetical protein